MNYMNKKQMKRSTIDSCILVTWLYTGQMSVLIFKPILSFQKFPHMDL